MWIRGFDAKPMFSSLYHLFIFHPSLFLLSGSEPRRVQSARLLRAGRGVLFERLPLAVPC
jgi:hypothetical protein